MPTKPATKSKTPTPSRKRGKPAIVADEETVQRAIQDLGINRPFYTCRVVGARLEFSLYGGDLIYWPPKQTREKRS